MLDVCLVFGLCRGLHEFLVYGLLEFDMNAWFLDCVQVDMNTWFTYGDEFFGVGN